MHLSAHAYPAGFCKLLDVQLESTYLAHYQHLSLCFFPSLLTHVAKATTQAEAGGYVPCMQSFLTSLLTDAYFI